MGVIAGLGFVGLFVLLFSPRLDVPFWFFFTCAVFLTSSLGALIGASFDVALKHTSPFLAAASALAGTVIGAYYAQQVYRAKPFG